MIRCVPIVLIVGAGLAFAPRGAQATENPDDESASLFALGIKALHDGRAGDAINAFEAFADQGGVDATASYDRGLAYAMRVHIGAEKPGDLGRAAQGFEEARGLSHDRRAVDDASRALDAVRSEVARRAAARRATRRRRCRPVARACGRGARE